MSRSAANGTPVLVSDVGGLQSLAVSEENIFPAGNQQALADLLGRKLGPAEIDALFKRRDQLVEILQERIDQWGEDIVLFDQRPPTETAPWVGD